MPDRCRLCHASGRESFLRLTRAPGNISRLLEQHELGADRPVDLQVLRCQSCGFVQIDPVFEEDHYQEYLMTVSHSAQMRSYQERQAQQFVTRFRLAGKRLVEVGCGDGNYLTYLQTAGAEVRGIEPSRRFRELARQRGFTIYEGFVSRATPVPDAPYAAFATRQVLEHVPDPLDFLLGVRRSVSKEAFGLVEVPSLEQALDSCRFYDFFADHLNYFSAATLRLALEQAGFEVLETSRGMNGEFNVALVRVMPELAYHDFDGRVQKLLRELRDFVAAHQSQGHRVAVWGAGGKGLSVLALGELEGIAYVIDSDPHKQGLYTPVSHLPIVAPEQLRIQPVEAIVLTALAYKEEVVRELRQTWQFQGPIATLGVTLDVLEMPEGCA